MSNRDYCSAQGDWDAGIRATLDRIAPYVASIQKIFNGCHPEELDNDDIMQVTAAFHIVAMRINKRMTNKEYSIAIEQLADESYEFDTDSIECLQEEQVI